MLVVVSIFLLLQIMLKCNSLYIGKILRCSIADPEGLCICTFDRHCLTVLHGVVPCILPPTPYPRVLPTAWFPVAQSFQPARLPLCMVYSEPRHTPDLISDNNVFPLPPTPPICMGGDHLQKVMPLKCLKPRTPFSFQPSRLQCNKHSETL